MKKGLKIKLNLGGVGNAQPEDTSASTPGESRILSQQHDKEKDKEQYKEQQENTPIVELASSQSQQRHQLPATPGSVGSSVVGLGVSSGKLKLKLSTGVSGSKNTISNFSRFQTAESVGGPQQKTKKRSSSPVKSNPAQGNALFKKIRLTPAQSAGGSKIKLALGSNAKIQSPSSQSLPPAPPDREVLARGGRGRRGRGKGGRGQGRPTKKISVKDKRHEEQDDVKDMIWEDELILAQVKEQSMKKGPGRLPKSLQGHTPAQPHEIHILIDKIWERDYDNLFKQPVTDDEAPGYSSIITEPMDLSTIRSKNDAGAYITWESVAMDIYLMFRNALRYNNKEDEIWKMAKTQQMHARSLIDNARQGKIMVNAKTEAANAARKETLAAKADARAKMEEERAKVRAEQRAAQEAKIRRKAGIQDTLEDTQIRASFRESTAGTYQGQWGGLGGGKSGDGVSIGLAKPMFVLSSGKDTDAEGYRSSIERFCSFQQLSSPSDSVDTHRDKFIIPTMIHMLPKYLPFSGLRGTVELFGRPPQTRGEQPTA